MKYTILLLFVLFLSCFAAQDSSAVNNSQPQQNVPQLEARIDSAEFSTTPSKAEPAEAKNDGAKGIDWIFWLMSGGLAAVLTLLLRLYLNSRSKVKATAGAQEIGKKDAQQEIFKETSEQLAQKYQTYLKKELGKIHLLGHRDLDNIPLDLSHTFVNLNITESDRSEERFREGRPEMPEAYHGEKSADDLLKDIFSREIPLIVIIGEPGAGKTTIEKYYGLCCFDREKCLDIGFFEDIFPIFLPLRELKYENGEPEKITECLARIADKNLLSISAEIFLNWLEQKKTLLLLDGLDEIGNPEHRKAVCRMIDRLTNRFGDKSRIIVTCRGAVYSKEEGVYLNENPLRADVKDLSLEQQEIFLQNWFYAVNRQEKFREKEISREEDEQLRASASREAQPLIEYLKDPENKSVRQLAGVPLMLQLMAFLWKYRRYKPDNARGLYQTTLLYILGDRDKERGIPQSLKSDEMMEVLMPVALKMIEIYDQDFLSEADWRKELAPELEKYAEKAPAPKDFLKYLYERSGLLAKYQDNQFIFKHKSFLEFLAAKQLREQWNYRGRMDRIVSYFGNKSWENTLQFFMHLANADVFDKFMKAFFQSDVSKDLSQNEQNLLRNLILSAPQKKIDALTTHLTDEKTTITQKRYILECLRQIPTEGTTRFLVTLVKEKNANIPAQIFDDAKEVLVKFKEFMSEYAGEIKVKVDDDIRVPDKFFTDSTGERFYTSHELGAEYILIPGGKYIYQKGKELEKEVTVPNLYFAKYPVTNQRYRRFIRYMAGEEADLQTLLKRDVFAELLLQFAESDFANDKNYREYLGRPDGWAKKLRSDYDDDKRFNGDDQPVVGISWYAARAYCLWLSCLALAEKNSAKIELQTAVNFYKLPAETEWEWAAGGGMREYPWGDEPKPNEKLANYGNNVGATTPVGRYPEGATPAGLMDMAGNVWEWQENKYQTDEKRRALRGGSWFAKAALLACSARVSYYPDLEIDSILGFRVVRFES